MVIVVTIKRVKETLHTPTEVQYQGILKTQRLHARVQGKQTLVDFFFHSLNS